MNSRHIYYIIGLIILVSACAKKQTTSVDCVTSFVIACQEHDISKAWNLLSPEAQQFYNDIGEKNRKSGKGILEHDISEAVKFKNENAYKITGDSVNTSMVRVISPERVFDIETVNMNGEYKIKEGTSVSGLIKIIAVEIEPKNYY